ncbi:mannosyltransferase [Neonectria punicea]|uniref:Mannosyltransferase n=1 Tax=Neonectria punicea TaxID=979145 RepID=A0ABR1HSG2_9HYPO
MFPWLQEGVLSNTTCALPRLPRWPAVKVVAVFVLLTFVLSLWELSSRLSANYQRVATTPEEPQATGPSPTYRNGTNVTVTPEALRVTGPSSEMLEFWSQLATKLYETKPIADKISAPGPLGRDNFDPFGATPQTYTDVLEVPEDQFQSLRQKHEDFAESIKLLAPRMPYIRDTRGVVITSKASSYGIAVTAILMLRHIGSKLPVQLFLDSTNEHERERCDRSLSELQVKCLNMDDYLRLPENSNRTTPKLAKFQFKSFSILFSSFQEVLFLDADAFPIRQPDYLFEAEPYKSHGLVTWPDFWLPTISPIFYNITGTEMPNVTLKSRSSESGVMLYDKARHADSLLLAVYYNFYGPKFYYQLQSQGAWGSGDKETFLQSAVALGNPVWQVKTPPEMITPEGINYGSGIWQADPEQDWMLDSTAAQSDEKSQERRAELENETGRNTTRTMFVHLNRVKVDTRRLTQFVGDLSSKDEDEDDTVSRMWGPDSESVVEVAGYDLEKVIWEEIIKANCEHSFLDECERIRDYYDEVFNKE